MATFYTETARFWEAGAQANPETGLPLLPSASDLAVFASVAVGSASTSVVHNYFTLPTGVVVYAIAKAEFPTVATSIGGVIAETVDAASIAVTAETVAGIISDATFGLSAAVTARIPVGTEPGASLGSVTSMPVVATVAVGTVPKSAAAVSIPIVAELPAGTEEGAIFTRMVYATIAVGSAARTRRAQLRADIVFSASGDITALPNLEGTATITSQAFGTLAAPTLPELRTLGCGQYEVWLMLRGGTPIRRIPQVEAISYGRVLNGTSEAQITLTGGGSRDTTSDCCDVLATINPWQHEIAIFRGGDGPTGTKPLVWVGPVRRIEIDPDANRSYITAKDLSSWFDRRFYHGLSTPNAGIAAELGDTIPDLDVEDVDLAYIWNQVVTDALAPDNPGITIEPCNPTKIPATRFVSRSQYRYAGDVLREISTSGVDYTVVNRMLRAGPSEIQTPAIGLIADEHFAVAPRVIVDGDFMGTRWVVGGGGTGQEGPDEAGDTSLTLYVSESVTIPAVNPIDPDFGLLEQYVFQPEIEDAPGSNDISTAAGSGRPSYPNFTGADNTDASYSIYQAARTRWQLHHEPYVTIEGGELDPNAPFDLNTLVPGSILQVHLSTGCREVKGFYRLRQIDVLVDDKRDTVQIRIENLGTTATVVPTAGTPPRDLPLVV